MNDAVGSLPFAARDGFVPTLVRFLVVILILTSIAFGVVYALATLVTVTPRSMEQIVPPARLNR